MKLARGETRPSMVNYEQPLPRNRPPRMPDGMERDAQNVWRRVLREMPNGVILAADTGILRAYCEAEASYVKNRTLLGQTGSLVRGARGRELVVNPLSRVVREEREAMLRLGDRLGLNPSARSSMRIDLNESSGDLDDVLGPSLRLRVVGGPEEP